MLAFGSQFNQWIKFWILRLAVLLSDLERTLQLQSPRLREPDDHVLQHLRLILHVVRYAALLLRRRLGAVVHLVVQK
jgi:hypothetical protein